VITPLNVRSGFSLLRGTTSPERLVQRARKLGHARLALTDFNGLYAAPAFDAAAQEGGIEPILGAELHSADGTALALVRDDRGYGNLCRLITRRHRPRPESLASDLAKFAKGLEVIVEDPSFARIVRDARGEAKSLWVGIDPAAEGRAATRRTVEGAETLGLPLVALGKALLPDAGDMDVARLLAAMRLGTTVEGVSRSQLPSAEACLRSPDRLLEDLASFPDAVANNHRVAERCAAWRLLPRGPVFPAYECPDGRRPREELRRLCDAGIRRRYGDEPPRRCAERLERELRLIGRMGFAEYFLVVWDIVRYARERGVPVAGRGSGASSLVAYLLGITNVCPLTYEIPFERFLNEYRQDFPDLDVDFCWRIRDDVLDYVFRRWGPERSAMVCMYNTFQDRSALREVARAMGYSEDQISGRATGVDEDPERLERVRGLASRLVGLPHNLSVHPGGVVIAPRAIEDHTPIEPATKGVLISQYDKHGVEAVGLVKLDLLGNRSLSTIRTACELVRREHGDEIRVESLPAADPPVIAMLQVADTVGCNQIESPAMRHLLRAFRPEGVADLMKTLALIRPGAASLGMKETFIRRKRGLERVPAGYAPVDRALADTWGVMLYEDDVMFAAAAILGALPAEADGFRKAVQKCRDDAERLRLSRRFLARCRANGVDNDYAKGLWVQMAKFNSYSFCRAHAGSYAMLAYALAWLKHHYPVEFWVAALNNNQSMYHPRVYIEQARRAGVGFLPVDVNRSEAEFDVQGGRIRVALNRVGGLGPASVEAILDARDDGAFRSLSDFLDRTGLGEEETRALVLCGAFDAMGRTRPQLMMEMGLHAARPQSDRGRRELLSAEPVVPEGPPDFDPRRKYLDERRILGFSVRGHVMSLYRPALRGAVDADSRDLTRRVGQRASLAGVVEAIRTTRTQRNRGMMFVTLDDEYGLFEVTFFADACRRIQPPRHYGPYVVSGRVEEQYDSVTVTADALSWFRAGREHVAP
jgi:DNA polymerase III subunit alpha